MRVNAPQNEFEKLIRVSVENLHKYLPTDSVKPPVKRVENAVATAYGYKNFDDLKRNNSPGKPPDFFAMDIQQQVIIARKGLAAGAKELSESGFPVSSHDNWAGDALILLSTMLLSSVKNRKKKEEANNPESAVPSDGRLRLPAPQVAVKYIEMISEALKIKYPLKVKGKPIEDLVANAHGYETAKDMVVGSQGSPSLTFFNQPFFERCADVMTALATVMKDLDNRASELEWALSRSVEIAEAMGVDNPRKMGEFASKGVDPRTIYNLSASMHFVPDISLMREDLNDVQVIDMEFYPPDDTGFQTHQVPERILVLFGNGETLEVRGANLWRFLDEIPERLRAEDGWYVRRHYFPKSYEPAPFLVRRLFHALLTQFQKGYPDPHSPVPTRAYYDFDRETVDVQNQADIPEEQLSWLRDEIEAVAERNIGKAEKEIGKWVDKILSRPCVDYPFVDVGDGMMGRKRVETVWDSGIRDMDFQDFLSYTSPTKEDDGLGLIRRLQDEYAGMAAEATKKIAIDVLKGEARKKTSRLEPLRSVLGSSLEDPSKIYEQMIGLQTPKRVLLHIVRRGWDRHFLQKKVGELAG